MTVPTPTPSANAREKANSGRLAGLPGEGARLVAVDTRRDWNQVFASASAPGAGSGALRSARQSRVRVFLYPVCGLVPISIAVPIP
jgi:hypothetical protein